VISQRVVSIADGIFEWGGAFSCKETILGVLYGCEEPLFKDNSHMYLLCFFTDFGFGLIVMWNGGLFNVYSNMEIVNSFWQKL
jgi:hypothetical protein